MSMARVVITAVVLEGRPKTVVARDYGAFRRWVQILVARYLAEGETAFEPRSRRPHTSPQKTGQATEDAIVALRKELAGAGLDAGAGDHRLAPAPAGRLRALSGDDLAESCPAAGSSPRSRTSGPAPPGTCSPRTCPTNYGRPTSPTGRWPMAATPRSSTSSMTIPGCWPPPPPGASSRPP